MLPALKGRSWNGCAAALLALWCCPREILRSRVRNGGTTTCPSDQDSHPPSSRITGSRKFLTTIGFTFQKRVRRRAQAKLSDLSRIHYWVVYRSPEIDRRDLSEHSIPGRTPPADSFPAAWLAALPRGS